MWTPEELKHIVDLYNQGLPTGYTDEEYDRLLEEYIKVHGESSRPYMRNKQTDVVNSLVCTLPKAYGVVTPMREGQKTYQQWVDTKKFNDNKNIIVQPKFDGCSVAYDFTKKKFFTRGDYENGESVDVTELFEDRIEWFERLRENTDRKWPWKTVGLKFEAILDIARYEKYNRTHLDNVYKRPRDYVAAAMTSRNKEMCSRITLIGLRGLTEDGREYIPVELWNNSVQTTIKNYDRIETFIKDCLKDNALFRMSFDAGYDEELYMIDGVVVSVVEDEPGEEMFINDGNEIAIKILKDVRQTKLRDIKWQVGNTGKITPVAILQPVKFDNVTVDHVTLSTFERVIQMDLRHNDTVDIMYNIVPYCIGSQHDGDLRIPIPENCPECGQPFMRSLKTVRCLNPDCKSVKIGGITRYCEKMKMVGISYKTIETLYDNGIVKSIDDLYKIPPTSISIMPGYGDKAEANILNAIKSSSENVEIHKWFGALPINDTSDKTWKQAFDVVFYNNEACVNNISLMITMNAVDDFAEMFTRYHIPNIGPAKIRNMVCGIRQNWNLIRETFPYIKFKITSKTAEDKGTVAMTGTRDAELTKMLKDAGWNVVDYNTKVDMLIIPREGFTSNKTESAMKHNIPIKTVDEILQWIRLGG